MRVQPLIAVNDVEASSRWYQRLLECQSGHGGPLYAQLLRDGEMFMQLHTDVFDAAVARARALAAEIVQEPKVNPNSRQREIWLRDPDGYVVVIAGR